MESAFVNESKAVELADCLYEGIILQSSGIDGGGDGSERDRCRKRNFVSEYSFIMAVKTRDGRWVNL
jgi:hypothetical protein